MEQNEEQEHYESAENKSCDGRGDHRHNHFRPDTGVPFDDRPIAMGGRERRAAKTANERVARARRQTKPPRRHVPNESGEHCAEHGPHRHDFGIDQTFADGGSDGAAKERAGQIKKRRHRDRLARRENFSRDNGGDGVGRIVKTVAVFKYDRREDDDDEKQHVDLVRQLPDYVCFNTT